MYTDDLLLMGESEEHAVAIQRICSIVLQKLGKKVSPKCDRSVMRNCEHAGLSFTKGGVQLSDAPVEQLRLMLDVMPKGQKQMQRRRQRQKQKRHYRFGRWRVKIRKVSVTPHGSANNGKEIITEFLATVIMYCLLFPPD